jgi:membrane-bound lytic murein transglycosylase A
MTDSGRKVSVKKLDWHETTALLAALLRRRRLAAALVGAAALAIIVWLVMRAAAPPARWNPDNALKRTAPFAPSDDHSPDSLLAAIDSSLAYYQRQSSPEEKTKYGTRAATISEAKLALLDFKDKLKRMGLSKEFFEYVRDNYTFFESAAPKVLFTGYFVPVLRGSRTKSDKYRHPLYAVPEDLYHVQLSSFTNLPHCPDLPEALTARLARDREMAPYYSRDEIDYEGKLAGRGLEIAWVEDAVDAFFLHIQGSGVVLFEDGTRLLAGYADKNGHPYRSIGRLLLDRGLLPNQDGSMQAIKAYLRAHPEMLREVLGYNPSYVFFKGTQGEPMGSLRAPLTAYRSIATDSRLFPKGALGFIKTRVPVFNDKDEITGWKDVSRFVLNQDTGGAIRGPNRVDLFTGAGRENELIAGHLRERGRLYFLLKERNGN